MGVEQIVAHLVGDYVIQTDWMAAEKTKRLSVALVHALVYALPFLVLTQSPAALAVIVGTHALIDRYRVARAVVWAKNQIAPARYRYPWADAAWHGYRADKPDWLAGWLLIIADNALHVAINAAALALL